MVVTLWQPSPVHTLRIARVLLLAVAALVLSIGVIRFVANVPNGEGGHCGPGWTTEYDGPCDTALKAGKIDSGVELVLAWTFVGLAVVGLRDPASDGAAI